MGSAIKQADHPHQTGPWAIPSGYFPLDEISQGFIACKPWRCHAAIVDPRHMHVTSNVTL